jgi:hypothetical protein
MRTLALVLLAAACGGSSPRKQPQPAPAPLAPAAPPSLMPQVETTLMPEPELPADGQAEAPMRTPIFERLHDEGDLAGVPGWSLKHVTDDNYCGGTRVVVSRGKRKLPAEVIPLTRVYSIPYPTGLDFSPDAEPRRNASLKRFAAFIERLKRTGNEANAYYLKAVNGDDPEGRIRGTARLIQVQLRVASLLARAERPKDLRTGEFAADRTLAFCDKMYEIAEPMVDQAEMGVALCAKLIEATSAASWWTSVCTVKEGEKVASP